MKLPPEMMVRSAEMIVNMLPYEAEYIPKTPQGNLILDLLPILSTPDMDLVGFARYTAKAIDECPTKQKKVDIFINSAMKTINEYKTKTDHAK